MDLSRKYYSFFLEEEFVSLTPLLADNSNLGLVISARKIYRAGKDVDC